MTPLTDLGGQPHNKCGRRHRTVRTTALCCWPGAHVWGDGPYAVVSRCRWHARELYMHRVLVVLFEAEAEVIEALAAWDVEGCCTDCTADPEAHQAYCLTTDAATWADWAKETAPESQSQPQPRFHRTASHPRQRPRARIDVLALRKQHLRRATQGK
jgi:hypothetical protein